MLRGNARSIPPRASSRLLPAEQAAPVESGSKPRGHSDRHQEGRDLCTSASDIRLQPCAARLVDPDPSRGVAGYINDQQLVLISDARFQSVAYLARSMNALHDPNCFKVIPPMAKRLYCGKDLGRHQSATNRQVLDRARRYRHHRSR
jgi:hypothetical protein